MAKPKTKKVETVDNTASNKREHNPFSRGHIIGWSGFFLVALVIGLQLIYPSDRVLPNAKLGEQAVGGWRFNDVATRVNNQFMSAEVTIRLTNDVSMTYPLATTGAQPDTELIRQRLVDYPLWQRLIPFSALVRQPRISAMPVFFTTDKLSEFAKHSAEQLSRPSQNAGLKIVDGRLVATADKPGIEIDAERLVDKLSRQPFAVNTVVVAPRNIAPAEKPAKYFAEVRDEAQRLLGQKVIIVLDGKDFAPTRAELAGWYEIGEDDDGQAELAINQSALRKYLQDLQTKTRTPSTRTNITVVDGRETKRDEGTPGRQIDTAALVEDLRTRLLSSADDRLIARFVAIKPEVVINNTYTSSQAGLQAFVSDQVNTKNVRIAVEQLDGERWKAYGRANESTVSASTYKLFVALHVLADIEKGQLKWTDKMLDTDVRGCFERMVVISLNTCAETWIGQYGRANLNQYLWQAGFSRGTDFNNPLATHTTAKDLTDFFRRLQAGSLMSSQNRQVLLEALHSHGYTRGIPAGSEGRVHNKVGFLWDYSNDAAIVYHPRGTYAIAVLTKGLSFYAIADITREIERIMYP